jgi:anti-sigma regulatory factor (Ser/Thr protein kinase)
VKIDLPADPSAVAVARRRVREACQGLDIDIDDVVLCASELVTNALLHGDPPIELEVNTSPAAIRVAVHDCGGGTVELRRAALAGTAGRGLHIIESIASRWGTNPRRGGKTTWFELEIYS